MTDLSMLENLPPETLREVIAKEKARRLFSGDRVALAKKALAEIEPDFEDLDPWQEDFLGCEERRIIVNCSRQIGKSTTASVYALHTALFVPKSLVLIVAPALRQSQEFFKKVMPVYNAVGELVEAESEQKLTLELANGSRIVALPGTEKTIVGFSKPRLIIIDEAARIDDELYSTALRPMLLRSKGQIMLLSSPYGKRGIFYKIWTEGEGWKRIEVRATEVPSLDKTFLEEERREKTPQEFAQEYLCAFVDTEDVVFPGELVEAAKGKWHGPLFPNLSKAV